MKVQFPPDGREGLLTACQLTSVAVATREVKPILRNLKAIASEDRCTLMATDLEIGVRYTLRGVQVEEAGEAILPAARLLAILRESGEEELTLEADDNRCLIRTPGSEFEMPSEDPADFPDIPTFADNRCHELDAKTLRTMVRRTVFAAGKGDNARFNMSGVLWEVDGERVRLVATDSKRLAMAEGPAIGHGGHDTKGQSHLVPTKAMNLLERILQDDDEETVRVSLRPNEVLFQTQKERATVYSRLVEGRYPPYREIIPKKSSAKVPLPVERFLMAVRQAAIMTDEESKRVGFHFADGRLRLEAQGAATGRSKVEMPVEYDGPPLDISFDAQYVVEMLRVLEADEPLTLELTDGSRPALFRSDKNYMYLVMPLS
jgi:DNA polymerase-3 subunit beta